MKILVADQLSDAGIEILRQCAQVDVRTGLKPDQLRSIVGDYEALIVRSQTKVTANIIEAGTKLQVIGRAGVGIDNIDVEAATARGILVINSPEGNIISTAEHTIAMMLAMARQIPKANDLLHKGTWNRSLKGTEIRNKTLGLIGLGRVGGEVAQLAKGLRMNIIAYDTMVSEAKAEKLGVKLENLKTLLKTSDFISVHIPLNSKTKGLIGQEQLKLMKPTAMIINCARGGIIEEQALNDALDKGIIAAAAIDVFSEEPAQNNILVKSDKVITTPHLAASTSEAEMSASKDIAEQIVSVLSGNPPKSPINAPAIPAEVLKVIGPYMELGKTIGRIAMQLVTGHLESLMIHYEGLISREETSPIKVAILSGLFETMTDERVNIVNADRIAAGRGLRVIEQKDIACENYTNMISVEIVTSAAKAVVGASVLRGKTYITRVDDYWMEIEPSANYMVFTEHKDRPGMIGVVGTILGNAHINIKQMHVSSGVNLGNNAMMALCMDQRPSEQCYQQMLAIPDMYRVVVVNLTKI
ncbi:MAG TPA: phosphoglycerate dehydrogenase [Dehalococcoidia bacterium]|nr:phosphoglycerate dehydrogenase [Dehalococcoidia bacterium]